ncbi:MAG: ribonuclease III [Clostridia bacterium]|nr:ribonuclease III [Clostridia bacterium]MBR6479528.1 ribonuclease III [Clostridia bacterium]MBR6512957.1 ribonuclease III [Clostridia bacterium]
MDNLSQLSPLTLAFIGDSVYELLVREALVLEANRPGADYHAEKLKYVSASAQASAFSVIEPLLTPSELDIFKRGRNAHTTHTPKNMTSADYHTATGLEALFGWLYLAGEIDRLRELMYNILHKN